MSTFYNENDPKAAAWLRELIKEGHIAPGIVDERSIIDIKPHELTGFTQQHFFAGIGGWSLALRLAGWPDSRPVRTGSCPCQPFSAAGNRRGEADARHLWPHFRDVITFGEPTITFGEQVASKDGRLWLARVRADLEGLGYAVGAADLCAAGVGAPHIRQRLYWMAHATGNRRRQRSEIGRVCRAGNETAHMRMGPLLNGNPGRLGDPDTERREESESQDAAHRPRRPGQPLAPGNRAGRLGDTTEQGPQERGDERGTADAQLAPTQRAGAWSAFDLLQCLDGKARRIEPGSFPLAHGVSGRVGLLRGYGNAIVPETAAEFIQACEEALGILTPDKAGPGEPATCAPRGAQK